MNAPKQNLKDLLTPTIVPPGAFTPPHSDISSPELSPPHSHSDASLPPSPDYLPRKNEVHHLCLVFLPCAIVSVFLCEYYFVALLQVKEDEDDDDDAMSGSSDRSQRGMLDTSRMMLCMFMMTVVAFNPLGLAIDGAKSFSSQESHTRGRSILSSHDAGLCFVLIRFDLNIQN